MRARLSVLFTVSLAFALAACSGGTPGTAHGGAANTAPAAAKHDTLVSVASGKLQGMAADGVDEFLGIPFAAPPVGPLRWKAPQPVAAWQGVRQATQYGHDCMQSASSIGLPASWVHSPSEDCLYLNVWTPSTHPHKPLPVMVWIYGGAFTIGSGAWPMYRGTAFARRGVVLVTFNYRLGRFGFFAHPALTQANPDGPLGDYGFMDQIAALEWVRKNIAAFGGDPHNVTIFGESAGGMSVTALLVSPLARGLFDKAISESGGGQMAWLPIRGSKHSAEAQGEAWARSVGVTGDGPAALAKLRALPAKTVLGPPGQGLSAATPIIDGKLLPMDVDKAFLEGKQAKVPFIVGANSYEQSLLQAMPNLEKTILEPYGKAKRKALELYTDHGRIDKDTALRQLWGEAFMVGPARFLARTMAQAGAPAWLYRFSYVPQAERGKVPGAGHGTEVAFVFDTLSSMLPPPAGSGAPGANQVAGHTTASTSKMASAAKMATAKMSTARMSTASMASMANAAQASNPDEIMAQLMHGYWVQFAKTGNPNGDSRLKWPQYQASTDQLLEFSETGPVVRTHFAKARLDFLDQQAFKQQGLTQLAAQKGVE